MIRNLHWGDVAELKYGKSLREYPETSSEENRFRVFGTNGPIGWHKTPLVDRPGIVIGRKGAYRGVHYSDGPFFVIDTAYYLDIRDPQIDLKWAFYQLSTVDINRMDSGSAIPSTKREDFYAVPVAIPPLMIQLRIAETLSAYDDLIENNRRRMALLEEAARLLYREWFVRLRFPGHEHARITNGLPHGWKQMTLGDLCTDVREAASPDQLEPETPYIGLEHMPRRSISLSEWRQADQVTSTKHRFREGEILFGKIRPYFHKVGVAFVDGVASSDAIVIRPRNSKFRGLLLMTVSSDPFVAVTAQTMKEGSKMPRADWKQMKQYVVPLPPDGLRNSFESVIQPIVEQLKALTFLNQKLRTARDLLLPRLMSGEIAV
ncbi:restriction endonuclease subunit S [Candidatus Nitrospira nitrificans]|uniref:Type I restriction modification DNA specificity domain-containing protein n=1 Tax=Candidatus Nitrospira nitrificans TaxID=1742973 RepID=A0A0S4L4L0_9BACT|nr:restriction endonuclease subunit S [Candidatus Nitrospira nitrificans]CUS31626.1 hypothetical protein COMA2_10207 [Candidatus Nitrospira nitrificans]